MRKSSQHPRRRTCILAAAVVSAAVAGGSFAWGAAARPAAAATLALLPSAEAGITPEANFETLSGAALQANVSNMASAGASWLRLDLFWPNVEPSRGVFNWSEPDPLVKAATAAGLNVLLVPDYTPSWTSVPGDPAAYAQMVSAAVAHFAPMGVHAWEIWNEPNMSWAWGPTVSAGAYTATLKAAYTAVKSVDPTATVVAGALSPAVDAADGSEISPLSFLNGIYAAGGGGYFDAVSVHPSSFPDLPMQADSWNTFYNLPKIHQAMVSHGDGAKKVWLTEYGAPTGSAGDAVSEATQAAMVSQAMSQVAQWSWAGPFFTYWQDQGSNPANDQDNFGMIRFDGSAKAAFGAYQAAVARVTSPSGPSMPAPSSNSSAAPSQPAPVTQSSGTRAPAASVPASSAIGSPGCVAPTIALAAPIVGRIPTPDGLGCWMVGSDGGVFTSGDAQFYGSAGALHLAAPVDGIAATPDGRGYWLVGQDGGVFTYGDAGFFGSAAGRTPLDPAVSMTASGDGAGYAIRTYSGQVFSFGDAG